MRQEIENVIFFLDSQLFSKLDSFRVSEIILFFKCASNTHKQTSEHISDLLTVTFLFDLQNSEIKNVKKIYRRIVDLFFFHLHRPYFAAHRIR